MRLNIQYCVSKNTGSPILTIKSAPLDFGVAHMALREALVQPLSEVFSTAFLIASLP